MVDVLKITSAIPATHKLDNLHKQLPSDKVFDLNSPENAPKQRVADKQERKNDPREALLRNLNREIFTPLKADLNAQTEGLKKLVMFLRFFNDPQLIQKLVDIDDLFIKPEELLTQLLAKDKNATVFQGDLFEALRTLAKAEGFPELQNAIINLLRAFDANLNRDNILSSLIEQSLQFATQLKSEDAIVLRQLLSNLASIIDNSGHETNQKLISSILKNELLPLLAQLSDKYQFLLGDKLENRTLSIIHQVVRFDKSDPTFLEESMKKLGAELRSFGRLSAEDVEGMRMMLYNHLKDAKSQIPVSTARVFTELVLKAGGERVADEAPARQATTVEAPRQDIVNEASPRQAVADETSLKQVIADEASPKQVIAEQGSKGFSASSSDPQAADVQNIRNPYTELRGEGREELKAPDENMIKNKQSKDISEIIAKALESDPSSKMNAAAQGLMNQLINNESPVMALLHFLFPIKFKDEEVYSEIYVDKEAQNKEEGGSDAINIFFVIHSDRYGDFSADLMARDRYIDLDIICPPVLKDEVRAKQEYIRGMMESLGYRMAKFQVSDMMDEQSILHRFPKLAMNRTGFDIRI